MKENTKLQCKLFQNYFLNNEMNEYKVFFGLFYTTEPNPIYQKTQNKTLLHKEKVGKNTKSSKSQMWQTFSQGLRKFPTLANLAKLLLHNKTCTKID